MCAQADVLGSPLSVSLSVQRAHAVHPITACQLEWSLWSRHAEVGLRQREQGDMHDEHASRSRAPGATLYEESIYCLMKLGSLIMERIAGDCDPHLQKAGHCPGAVQPTRARLSDGHDYLQRLSVCPPAGSQLLPWELLHVAWCML